MFVYFCSIKHDGSGKEDPKHKKRRWHSIYVMYFTMFLSAMSEFRLAGHSEKNDPTNLPLCSIFHRHIVHLAVSVGGVQLAS